MQTKDYSNNFSENGFWKTIRKYGNAIPFLRNAIAMYYCWCDPETPVWVKTIIVAALGYLISPFDAIPDIIPVLGWTDDAGIITGALGVIHVHITPEHWKKADEALGRC